MDTVLKLMHGSNVGEVTKMHLAGVQEVEDGYLVFGVVA